MGTEKKGELQERFLKDDPYRIPSQLAWEDGLEWVQGNPWRVAREWWGWVWQKVEAGGGGDQVWRAENEFHLELRIVRSFLGALELL